MNARSMILAGLSAAVLAGCAQDTQQVEVWVAEVRARPAQPLDPLPPLQTFPAYEYSSQGLRDPFAAPQNSREAAGPRPDPNRRKEALEAFPLDALRMVGTIGDGGGIVALVLAPDKVTHRVRSGNYLGQSDGRVVRIGPERIDMVELVSDGSGGWMERQATLALEDN